MSSDSASDKVNVYAVLRVDRFLGPGTPAEEMVTVKEVLATFEEAEAEVARLNGLIADGGVVYVVQTTRYFPKGRKSCSFGST